MGPLVSVIMPAYNAQRFIRQAIDSVLHQTHENWELLVVNDGSTDSTRDIILGYTDPRICLLDQENKGVSAARNLALVNATGKYLCLLDADDAYPPNSLESRLALFTEFPDVSFVDGAIKIFDDGLTEVLYEKKHGWQGPVFDQLILLNEKCFFGPSWMIKRQVIEGLRFNEEVTHGEELLFYIGAARKGGVYKATDEFVLHYRKSSNSAMANLDGLSQGYQKLYREVKAMPEASLYRRLFLNFKIRKIMALSFLSKNEYIKALNALVNLP